MITKTALKIAVPFPRVESFESYLFIGPHPDDIEIGAGATAAKLVSMGKKVTFLICTDGRYGTDNISGIGPDELAEKRKQESILSAKTLGVSNVRFLELSDGGFYDLWELEEGIAKTVAEVKPDMVFAPDPDVTSECHKDHLNTGNCAKIICQFSGNPGIMEKYGAEA